MSDRFVILHHRLPTSEHWDLMLEHGEVLLTWQLFHEPVDASSLPIVARRIGDHRKAYLEYEGPVSGDRGEVRRIDRGALTIHELTATRCEFSAEGERLNGRFVLARRDSDEWLLEKWR